jgi:CBS domain-containing protein
MRCADLMKTSVVYVTESESAQTAAQLMREGNIGFLPVVDAQKKALGALTDRDLAVRVCADDRQASGVRVRDIMSRAIVACRPEDDLEVARELMGRHQKSRIMVVGDDAFLRGVLSLSDLADLDQQRAAETLREVSSRAARPS